MGTFVRHTWDLLLKGGLMVTGFLHGMVSGNNQSIVLLLVLMIADYLAGVTCAMMKKSRKSESGGLSSAAGAKGLLKKGLMLLVVVVAYALDHFVGNETAMFQSAITWFYISNEGLSLVENLAQCGVPIPKKFLLLLEKLAEDKLSESGLRAEEISRVVQPQSGDAEEETSDATDSDDASSEIGTKLEAGEEGGNG